MPSRVESTQLAKQTAISNVRWAVEAKEIIQLQELLVTILETLRCYHGPTIKSMALEKSRGTGNALRFCEPEALRNRPYCKRTLLRINSPPWWAGHISIDWTQPQTRGPQPKNAMSTHLAGVDLLRFFLLPPAGSALGCKSRRLACLAGGLAVLDVALPFLSVFLSFLFFFFGTPRSSASFLFFLTGNSKRTRGGQKSTMLGQAINCSVRTPLVSYKKISCDP